MVIKLPLIQVNEDASNLTVNNFEFSTNWSPDSKRFKGLTKEYSYLRMKSECELNLMTNPKNGLFKRYNHTLFHS
jgi:hypothetical protein